MRVIAAAEGEAAAVGVPAGAVVAPGVAVLEDELQALTIRAAVRMPNKRLRIYSPP